MAHLTPQLVGSRINSDLPLREARIVAKLSAVH